jgi:hypothetical protein
MDIIGSKFPDLAHHDKLELNEWNVDVVYEIYSIMPFPNNKIHF